MREATVVQEVEGGDAVDIGKVFFCPRTFPLGDFMVRPRYEIASGDDPLPRSGSGRNRARLKEREAEND